MGCWRVDGDDDRALVSFEVGTCLCKGVHFCVPAPLFFFFVYVQPSHQTRSFVTVLFICRDQFGSVRYSGSLAQMRCWLKMDCRPEGCVLLAQDGL